MTTAVDQLRLLARYNRWMNARLYDACAALDPQELAHDRGAFFGSILGTLNHLCAGDLIWLRRFALAPGARGLRAALDGAGEAGRVAEVGKVSEAGRVDRDQRAAPLPSPQSLREPMAADLAGLRALRERIDAAIDAWVQDLTEIDLDSALEYRNMSGAAQRKPLGPLALHFFNHQTHHRGQATTLLYQAGIDPGVTDLLAMIPGVPPAGG